MTSVLISIKPYWVFLIMAHNMGWDIPNPKTIEVRKSYPKDDQWNHKVIVYCTGDKKSFQRIPKQYQPAMKEFLGKVVGEFTCDHIEEMERDVNDWLPKHRYDIAPQVLENTCLKEEDLWNYGKGSPLYGWHISQLYVYSESKQLKEFSTVCDCEHSRDYASYYGFCDSCDHLIKRPPQSWMYIEEV